MAFGKGKSRDDEPVWKSLVDGEKTRPGDSDEPDGPFEIEDFDTAAVAKQGRHDLGAVLIPENESAELAVEVNQAGAATTVWMVTPNGRYNITAYAAPKAGGLWREVVTELAESLRNDGAQVSIEDGLWGREVLGLVTTGPKPVAMRFIGVDGYRWMVRGAAIGTPASAEAIAKDMRNALADTVVRRGDEPQPVRAQLPLQLSDGLVARLRARAEQMTAEYAEQTEQTQQVAQQTQQVQPPAAPPPTPAPAPLTPPPAPVQRQPRPQPQSPPRPLTPQREEMRPAQPDRRQLEHEELLRQHEELLRKHEELLRQHEAQKRQTEPQPPQPQPQPVARRSEQGSAMQQLRTITGG